MLLVNEVCAPKTKTATVTVGTDISKQQQHLKLENTAETSNVINKTGSHTP